MRFSSFVVASFVGIVLLTVGSVCAQTGVTITQDGKVGIGTTTPEQELHIVNNVAGDTQMLVIENPYGGTRFDMRDGANSINWVFQNRTRMFAITVEGTGVRELELDEWGNLVIQGSLTTQGAGGTTYPDFVFSPEYELLPLADLDEFIQENGHLPGIPTAEETQSQGLNMTEMQVKLLQKVEELTLYTLAQEKRIAELERQLEEQPSGLSGTE